MFGIIDRFSFCVFGSKLGRGKEEFVLLLCFWLIRCGVRGGGGDSVFIYDYICLYVCRGREGFENLIVGVVFVVCFRRNYVVFIDD